MAGPGRNVKLDDVRQRLIVTSIAAGVPRKYAAQRAGVCERSLRAWLARGRREPDGIYAAFLAAIEKAEADALARNVAIIQKAANSTWQAAAWWLERRYPAEFGRKDKTVIHTGGKGNLGADVRKRIHEAEGPTPG